MCAGNAFAEGAPQMKTISVDLFLVFFLPFAPPPHPAHVRPPLFLPGDRGRYRVFSFPPVFPRQPLSLCLASPRSARATPGGAGPRVGVGAGSAGRRTAPLDRRRIPLQVPPQQQQQRAAASGNGSQGPSHPRPTHAVVVVVRSPQQYNNVMHRQARGGGGGGGEGKGVAGAAGPFLSSPRRR